MWTAPNVAMPRARCDNIGWFGLDICMNLTPPGDRCIMFVGIIRFLRFFVNFLAIKKIDKKYGVYYSKIRKYVDRMLTPLLYARLEIAHTSVYK